MKRAINTRAVELLPLAEARRQIEEGARQAVAAAKKPAPVRTGPYKVTMRFRDMTIPEVASAFREMERSAPDAVSFSRDTMPDAYRLIRVLYRYINTDLSAGLGARRLGSYGGLAEASAAPGGRALSARRRGRVPRRADGWRGSRAGRSDAPVPCG